MTNPVRVRIAKYMGDDSRSWAVFVDGVPAYTGMDRREAQYYRERVRMELGFK